MEKNPSAKKYKASQPDCEHVADEVKNLNPLSYAYDFAKF